MQPKTATSTARKYLLTSLLKEVSRSFYLTLRILPGPVRSQIGLAYLLARTSDTIADTEVLPLQTRLGALRSFRDAVDGRGVTLSLSNFRREQANIAERTLLKQAPEAVSLLDTFDAEDQQRIRSLLGTIIGGQELDLLRFGAETQGQINSLKRDEELDDYTYRVAGCVGEFWTHMCLAHLKGSPSDADRLVTNGIRFGKGLQMVNILRDLPADLLNGRCYLPSEELSRLGLNPHDLLSSGVESTVRPLYNRYLDEARTHLHAGWSTLNLPARWTRVRLACSWPILIGLATLRKLRQEPILDASRRIKVSREEVRRILVNSIIYYPFKNKWKRLADSSTR